MAFIDTLVNTGSVVLNMLIVVFGLILFSGLAWLSYTAIKRELRYDCAVKIFEPDGTGGLHLISDKGGVFMDKKTNNKRFFLKKMNVGLDPDNIPFIRSKNKKIVYLLKKGLKNFNYIEYNFDNEDFSITVGEEDVNWATNSYEKAKKAIISQNKLMAMLPWIAIAIGSICIMIGFIYLFKTATDIAPALDHMATAIKESGMGTGTRIV